jgi:hypothetical protein
MNHGPNGENISSSNVGNKHKNISQYAFETCVAFNKRFQMVKELLLRNDGPLRSVKDWYWRREYQQSGSVHIHMFIWCDKVTIPLDCVVAEMPRMNNCGANEVDELNYCREKVGKYMMHNCQKYKKCLVNNVCKYGYPFGITMSQGAQTKILVNTQHTHVENKKTVVLFLTI